MVKIRCLYVRPILMMQLMNTYKMFVSVENLILSDTYIEGGVCMSFYTNDPIADFHRHDAEQEDRLKDLPECSECGNPIQDEHYYEFDCYFYCENCVCDNHRKSTDSFIG